MKLKLFILLSESSILYMLCMHDLVTHVQKVDVYGCTLNFLESCLKIKS